MASQNRWLDAHEQILLDIAEALTDEQCQKLIHKLGVSKQHISRVIRNIVEPEEKRFVILRTWYRTSSGTPIQLAKCLADLDEISAEKMTHMLTILPLNLGFPLETKLVQLAKTIPDRNWNTLLEIAELDNDRKENIVGDFGHTRLMVIVLLHYTAPQEVPRYLEQIGLRRMNKNKALDIVGVKRGVFYRFVERPMTENVHFILFSKPWVLTSFVFVLLAVLLLPGKYLC